MVNDKCFYLKSAAAVYKPLINCGLLAKKWPWRVLHFWKKLPKRNNRLHVYGGKIRKERTAFALIRAVAARRVFVPIARFAFWAKNRKSRRKLAAVLQWSVTK
jgi:hypothetical protein